MKTVHILTALGGLVLGTGAAYINYLASKKALNKRDVAGIMGVNAVRLLTDALVLLAVYLVCRHFVLPVGAGLIAAATGLSLGGLLLLRRLAESVKNGDDGGE